MKVIDVERLMQDLSWATLHPDPALRQARARVLETRGALRVALTAARLAEAELRLADARQAVRRTFGPH